MIYVYASGSGSQNTSSIGEVCVHALTFADHTHCLLLPPIYALCRLIKPESYHLFSCKQVSMICLRSVYENGDLGQTEQDIEFLWTFIFSG